MFYDADGKPLWLGAASEDDLLYIPFTTSQARRFFTKGAGAALKDAGAAVGEGAADVLGPALNASKQEIEDVANKIGGGLSSVGSGVITQMNTMLLVLAGAYVLGQAVSGK